MKTYLQEKGIRTNKLGKAATKIQYDEMVNYLQTGKIPDRLINEEVAASGEAQQN